MYAGVRVCGHFPERVSVVVRVGSGGTTEDEADDGGFNMLWQWMWSTGTSLSPPTQLAHWCWRVRWVWESAGAAREV